MKEVPVDTDLGVMDTERLREALRWTIREPDGVVHQSKHRGHQAIIVDAATEHLQCLAPVSDEEVERAARAEAQFWACLELGQEFDDWVKRHPDLMKTYRQSAQRMLEAARGDTQ